LARKINIPALPAAFRALHDVCYISAIEHLATVRVAPLRKPPGQTAPPADPPLTGGALVPAPTLAACPPLDLAALPRAGANIG